MSDFHHVYDTNPRGRTAHRCSLCGKQIAKGSRHVKRFGYDSSGPVSIRMHNKCEDLTGDWYDDDWESGGEQDFRTEDLALNFRCCLREFYPSLFAKSAEDDDD